MSMMERTSNEILNLYLVFPKGYENHTAIVVSDTPQNAMTKAGNHPHLQDIVSLGAELMCMDINRGISTQGYTLSVSRLGMYH